MALAALTFVLVDRVIDFDVTCTAAGFDPPCARGVTALYSGLRRSERRIARALAERLWLPVAFEPALCEVDLGLDGEPAPQPHPGGAAALALARRHGGSRVALAFGSVLVGRIEAELRAVLPGAVATAAATDASVRVLELCG